MAFRVWFIGLTAALTVLGQPLRLCSPVTVVRFGKLWARLVLGSLRVLAGKRWLVLGTVPDGPALLAAQHQSVFETVALFLLLPAPAFIVKQELVRIPLFGPLLRRTGAIAVDRTAGAVALRAMLREAVAAADAGRQIVIFPEGTRMQAGTVGTIQSGIAALAATTLLPVIPVTTDSGRHWTRTGPTPGNGMIHMSIFPALSAGTPRAVLLRHLREVFEAAAHPARAVHNSVDRAAAPTTAD